MLKSKGPFYRHDYEGSLENFQLSRLLPSVDLDLCTSPIMNCHCDGIQLSWDSTKPVLVSRVPRLTPKRNFDNFRPDKSVFPTRKEGTFTNDVTQLGVINLRDTRCRGVEGSTVTLLLQDLKVPCSNFYQVQRIAEF